MKILGRIILALCSGGALAVAGASAEKNLLRVTGSYLAYSYDLNHVYGEDVELTVAGYTVAGKSLRISVSSRSFCILGAVVLSAGQETLRGDEFWFSPEKQAGVLLTYGETLMAREVGEKSDRPAAELIKDSEEISLAKIRNSMISFTARSIEISSEGKVYGYEAKLYVEGVESVGFKKINMTSGLSRDIAGFRIGKIWFNKSQGLITSLSHSYEKKDRLHTFSHLTYEERSILKNYAGLKRQFDLMTSWSANFRPDLSFALNGNYNSSNLWNLNAYLTKKWGASASSQLSFAYNKPVLDKGEGWFGLQSSLGGSKIGNLAAEARIGNDDQLLGEVSYSNLILRNVNLYLTSSYSRLRAFGGGESAKIWTNNISVSYVSGIFNLATDYYLNRDLVGHRSLSQPRLQLAVAPPAIYGGLLSVRAVNVLIFNESFALESKQRSYSNNLIFSLATSPIFVTDSLSLTVSSSLEQFMERTHRNFVTSGLIVNVRQEFARGVSLEGFYSAQSRRKAQGWMVEGTTSQDLSLVFRVDRPAGFSTWFMISYDPKYREVRSSFADLSLRIVKNWEFHALGTYDFQFRKVNNVDLYIVRKAGRFQLRFVWRSLSRHFLVELVPQ